MAEMSNGVSESTDGRERRSNTISSVGAAFGSFSRDVLQDNKVPTEEDQEMDSIDEEEDEDDEDQKDPAPIADTTDLPQLERIDSVMANGVNDIAERLDRCLGNVNPLLRDILNDFQNYLSKTLLGSHGQTLVPEGLQSISGDGSSTVSMVMLLCSQEWQNSIQKNAGLAFIELINEGRLFSHAMKEHAVRVGNEAEFILNRARADDVKRQADAESQHAQLISATRREEGACASLIAAARRRDALQGSSTARRAFQALVNPSGCWHSAEKDHIYWRLDAWEDDTRRRRRMVKNPWGSNHGDAINHSAKDIKTEKSEEKPITENGVTPIPSVRPMDAQISTTETEQSLSSLQDDDDISDSEVSPATLAGPATFSCFASLIAPGVALPGTLSIHAEEIYWEAADESEEFQKINSNLLRYVEGCPGKWSFHEIRAIYSRKYLLQNTGLEIFLANRTSIMFNFIDNQTVRKIVTSLPRVGIGTGYGLPQVNNRLSLIKSICLPIRVEGDIQLRATLLTIMSIRRGAFPLHPGSNCSDGRT